MRLAVLDFIGKKIYSFTISCRGAEELHWTLKPVSSATSGPPPLQLPDFNYPTGPTLRTKSAKTPLDTLKLFLTTVLLESILAQMKLCAEQKGIHCEIFLEELFAFIGLNLAMGLLRLPQVSDYWSKVEILETPWFPAVMSRDRFFFSTSLPSSC